jgi:uncharacterized membrane-anchored protein
MRIRSTALPEPTRSEPARPKSDWPKFDWPEFDWPKFDWPKFDWPESVWPESVWPKSIWPGCARARPDRGTWLLVRAGLILLATAATAIAAEESEDAGAREKHAAQAITASYRVAIGSPAKVPLRDQATLRLTPNLAFVPVADAARIIGAYDIAQPGNVVGIIYSINSFDWLGILRFVPGGYVDPDRVNAWTQDDLISSIGDTVAAEDAARLADGRPPREARGWIIPPDYDAKAHQLRWSALVVPKTTMAETAGTVVYNVVMPGREGYFHLEVRTPFIHVQDQARDAAVLLTGFRFLEGKDFDDIRPGTDRAMARGLETMLGVRELRRTSAPAQGGSNDLMMAEMAGGSLMTGALLLLTCRLLLLHRRRRRA